LALRHGWGVAKDEKRAFVELKQACDASLAEEGIDFHDNSGATTLTSQERTQIAVSWTWFIIVPTDSWRGQKDLSVGIFEIANCFLDGVGVKKAPDVALLYLRFAASRGDLQSQEQLGFLLSKGASGIKKDMKEAAKWYRMAVSLIGVPIPMRLAKIFTNCCADWPGIDGHFWIGLDLEGEIQIHVDGFGLGQCGAGPFSDQLNDLYEL
jgi:hypothetical protein